MVNRRRVRAAVAAALILCAAVLQVARYVRGRAARWRIVADTGGPITLAACSLNSARRAALRNAELVATIANALPERARLVVLTNDRAAFTVVRDPWPGRVVFVDTPAEQDVTIWPQDPFVVLRDGRGRACLLGSCDFERAGDRVLGEALARHLGWEWRGSGLRFEGGNIVADERIVFVGANTIRHNAVLLEETDVEVARRFEAELGRPVMVIGPVP